METSNAAVTQMHHECVDRDRFNILLESPQALDDSGRPLSELSAALRQSPEPQRQRHGTAVDRSNPNLPLQRIGPNDLIAVLAYDAPELSRTIRVSDGGVIRSPMLNGADSRCRTHAG